MNDSEEFPTLTIASECTVIGSMNTVDVKEGDRLSITDDGFLKVEKPKPPEWWQTEMTPGQTKQAFLCVRDTMKMTRKALRMDTAMDEEDKGFIIRLLERGLNLLSGIMSNMPEHNQTKQACSCVPYIKEMDRRLEVAKKALSKLDYAIGKMGVTDSLDVVNKIYVRDLNKTTLETLNAPHKG